MPWTFFCPDPCKGQVERGGDAPPGGAQCLKCGRIFESAQAIVAAGGAAAHICTRGSRASRCQEDRCGKQSVALCDQPLGYMQGTCDRRMCAEHRTSVGKNRDRCPMHAPKPPAT